jgi:molybdopterin converting factor subunit 1
MMKIKTKFFAGCQDIVGKREIEIEVEEGMTAGKLLERLIKDNPGLESLAKNSLLSINMEYTSLDTLLGEGDEVVLIPPVSGGGDV